MPAPDSKSKQQRYGGLQGKARHNRTRNRAWRLCSQQLIEDFVEPDAKKTKMPRHIPIKKRTEFNPSAPIMGSKHGVGRDGELKLVYATGSADEEGGVFDGVFALVPPDQDRGARQGAISFSSKIDKTEVGTKERDALFGNAPARFPNQFTAKGFAFGCALGTAAAAMLLMMVRVAFL